ncbi:MAG: ATP-binding protein [Nitrospinota bacterium]|nr:ATP-binding protein [Nitrospinota bacterium]
MVNPLFGIGTDNAEKRFEKMFGLVKDIGALNHVRNRDLRHVMQEAARLFVENGIAEFCSILFCPSPVSCFNRVFAVRDRNGGVTTEIFTDRISVEDSPFLLKMMEDGVPVFIDSIGDIEREARINMIVPEGYNSLFSIPVTSNSDTFLSLTFGYSEKRSKPEESEMDFLVHLAHQISDIQAIQYSDELFQNYEMEYRELFENSADVVIKINAQGEIEDINSQFTAETGLDAGDWIGKPISSLFTGVENAGYEIFRKNMDRFSGLECVLNGNREQKFYLLSSWPRFNSEGKMIGNWIAARDLTERKKKEMDLLRLKEKAEAANFSKLSLLNNVSHELKTPLTSIIGFGKLISCNEKIDTKVREQAAIVEKEGKDLLTIINSLLDVASAEKEWGELKHTRIQLGKFLKFIANGGKRGVLEISIDNDLPETIIADEKKLMIVLDQLVDNAFKFSMGKKVSLTARKSEGDIVFSVKDDGVGIEEKNLERVFEHFVQEDSGLSREFEGMGLGLPLAKTAVLAMGGRIWVDSIKGEGSTFHFAIPFVTATAE